ncbi:hypothetical protein LOTGIDRAFT_153464 [Lottia gigantea]|uniref:SLC26A/SulP transporter domain-containing protein n=1 Tax=Lottia gigantea TaxID=225164 RepID=V4AB22_LOTGI|nr:hypothetical protein LOTGIDRAFT_153464 [Lottia gigantea]ESO93987.1 hypothetical protein LOTGIDRAFT_153464 [Lottia gigantea]
MMNNDTVNNHAVNNNTVNNHAVNNHAVQSNHHPVIEITNCKDEIVPLTITPGNFLITPAEDNDYQNDTEIPDRELIIVEQERRLLYTISENPPFHMCILFGIQHLLTSISSSMSISLLVAEVVCAKDDDVIKTKILSTTMLISGISTFLMSTFGVRLPIYQGPCIPYIIPLLAMASFKGMECTNYAKDSNLDVINGTAGNATLTEDIIYDKIGALSGSLIAAGILHFLIGLTGLVGTITRYLGPITIAPAMTLVAMSFYTIAVSFSEKHWGVAAVTTITGIILALYLNGRNSPLPAYNKKRGFHIKWYPVHTVFSILISIAVGWILSAILTVTGAMSDDEEHGHHYARTDSRNEIIYNSPWFYLPYPGQFGGVSFSVAAFISFFVGTLMSVVDSIGDYNATSRVCCVPPPPPHAVNRGIFVEGVMSLFAGTTGACHATVSFGGNIGAIGVTKVASRRTFQVLALLYVIFALVLKVSAFFITIPYPVLGGTLILSFGIFIGLILSNLQFVDLNSTRNLAIVGLAILLGLMLPYWSAQNQNGIQTGNAYVDNVILMLISNGGFIGGFVAFVLDNTVPGTLKERGLLVAKEHELDATIFEEGFEVYELPWIPNCIKNSRIYKYVPIFSKRKEG